jgi:hypothetical protein
MRRLNSLTACEQMRPSRHANLCCLEWRVRWLVDAWRRQLPMPAEPRPALKTGNSS